MTSPEKPRSRQAEAFNAAVTEERRALFPTSEPWERERARAFTPCVYPMPACIRCGRFSFPVPTVCFWCRPTLAAADVAIDASRPATAWPVGPLKKPATRTRRRT